MREYFKFLANDFRSINIVALKRLQHSLIHFRLMDCLIGGKLEVGVFLRQRAQFHSLYISATLFQRWHIDRTVGYFGHFFNLLLHLILRGQQTLL